MTTSTAPMSFYQPISRLHQLERQISGIALFIIIFGGSFLGWHYLIDGRFVNRVIQFQDGTNPMDLKMVQSSYKVGDTPQFYSAYCKTRQAVSFTRWTLINEHPHYDTDIKKISDTPPGCYGLQKVDTKPIPASIPPGDYHFVGATTYTLPDGRIRTQYYQTEEFTVIK